LVSPLTLTANALASLGQYETAFDMYGQALHLNGVHYGDTHTSNIALLVDFGISLVHALQSQGQENGMQVLNLHIASFLIFSHFNVIFIRAF